MEEKDVHKKSIQLKLVTEIRDRGRKEQVNLETEGTLYEKDNATFLAYKEMMENVGSVSTIVKIKENEVTIVRSGGVSMRQTFRKGATTSGTYQSPYGTLEMVTKTEHIDYTYRTNSKKAKLNLTYQLEMQGESVGRHRLTFLIKQMN
ncbi:DUF1934 domain-containing protein [Bacillus sp. Marseille-P3661]|uniref:DUF1934 domain-containing protein n=1 Tax=Bacillus sp. Marseille-P3661 TaxID=1936234 RepID=UPI000C85892D|nr:DUF1934 domain-containing protein [Bacillus sp. Marseille-P3661]